MSTFITFKTAAGMHQRKAILLLALMQTMSSIVIGQRIDTTAASIDLQLKDNKAVFSSALRPLHPIAGAPEAFYSYYWEFGDGNFSFAENPAHVYKDTGDYDVRLFATNNYDDGKPPPLRPKRIKVRSKNNTYALDKSPGFFKQGGAIEMKVNCMPKPDEDMVLVMGYRNQSQSNPVNGSMLLFYNERQFRKNNFDFSEERTYNNETKVALRDITAYVPSQEIMQDVASRNTGGPNEQLAVGSGQWAGDGGFFGGNLSQLIAAKQKQFRANNAWRFTNLGQGEEKYFFITLHTTQEMIKDTNAVLELTGMFIPDNPGAEIEEYALELQIVASHDPNRMMLKNRRLSYRFTGKHKEMNYTVRFQNTGMGPARQVTVAVAVPPMMDARSIEIMDHYPKAGYCSKVVGPMQSCFDTIIHKDSVFVVFKDIYLPGIRQSGMRDPDSTVGFVKYRMHFSKELKKLPFESNASIVFDKNPAIHTNSPRGYFKPGTSTGISTGYNFFLGSGMKDANYFSVGASISPYAPFKKYLQAEIYLGYLNFPESLTDARTENKDTTFNPGLYHIFAREIYAASKIIKLDLVPLQLRKNFNDWVGGGVGTQLSFNAWTKNNNREVIHLVQQQQPNPPPITVEKTYDATKWFGYIDVAAFADLQLGRVRVGPAVGLRFLHYFRNQVNGLFVYATWRF